MDWIQNHRNLLLFEGIIFTLMGILAVALPGISTLSAELFIGWLLVFGGAVQLYRTFKTRESPGFWPSLLVGALYILFGALLVIYPVAGIFSLTALLIIFFIAEGLTKIVLGLQFRPFRRWGWFLVSGAIALCLAYIIWSGWPGTAFWVLGLLVGINMIFFGISLIYLALALPRDDTTA